MPRGYDVRIRVSNDTASPWGGGRLEWVRPTVTSPRCAPEGARSQMSRPKVTVIGAGNGPADVVLVDIVEGLPQGKALALSESAPVVGHDCTIRGTNDYADTAGSDIVVVTSGLARQPGTSRDDLTAENAGIVRSGGEQAVAHSP